MTLKEALIESEITNIWLSERLGLSRPTLRKYLKKPGEFKVKHFIRMSEYLQLSEMDTLDNYFKTVESYE